MAVVLHGYRYSVYTRIARVVLAEKGIAHEYVEVNPFAEDMPREYLALHPFRRVPALVHGGFVLYETAAIARYVDEAFAGPALQPSDARERARMAQIISVVDSYGYWPMVRQVFSQRVFGPRLGRPTDESQLRVGLDASARVLAALDALVASARAVAGGRPSLADFHLAPMIACFATAPEGAAEFARHAKLSAWWEAMKARASFRETDPGLPDGPPVSSAT
jgi:glutathione S-transferase